MSLDWVVNELENPFETAVGDHAQYIVHYAEFAGRNDEGGINRVRSFDFTDRLN